MTPLSEYDAWVTSEPIPTVDPHAPFEVVYGGETTVSVTSRGRTSSSTRFYPTLVFDARDDDAPALVAFLGVRASEYAERYAEVRNREAPPANEDGPGGQCTVCGDWHGEMRSAPAIYVTAPTFETLPSLDDGVVRWRWSQQIVGVNLSGFVPLLTLISTRASRRDSVGRARGGCGDVLGAACGVAAGAGGGRGRRVRGGVGAGLAVVVPSRVCARVRRHCGVDIAAAVVAAARAVRAMARGAAAGLVGRLVR